MAELLVAFGFGVACTLFVQTLVVAWQLSYTVSKDRPVDVVDTFEVFDLDDEPARWHYYSGLGTVWHYGVRGTTHGIDPVALHMARETAEFLAAALNAVGRGNTFGRWSG